MNGGINEKKCEKLKLKKDFYFIRQYERLINIF